MADKGNIGSRLQLDGEQEYRKALNDAYRSLRVLRSELKAETAELGRNATAQEKDQKKVESLKKQIQQQKEIVETLQKALEDSRKEYADNAEVQDKWEEKLNKAREALARMQNELGSTQDELKSFSSEMGSVGESSERSVSAVVNLNDALGSIKGLAGGVGETLSGIFSSTVETMEAMVDKMFELMGKAWSAAGDWKQLATIWGGSTEDIERVMTGMQLQGVDTGEVTSGIQKLVTNTDNGNKETMAALKALGISEKDYSNHWDYFMAVMQELSMRRHNGKDVTTLTTALFGDKAGYGMTDVVDNWNEALNKYDQDVMGTGLHLYDDEIEALDGVAHKIQEVQALWDVLKTNIGAKLSDVLNIDALSEDALSILRDFATIFSESSTGEMSEERKAELVMKLDTDIQTLLNDIKAALENLGGFLQELGGSLEDSDNPIVSFMGKLINNTGKLLEWVGTNGDTIISWLDRMLPLMAANKVSEAVTGKGIGDWVTDLLNTGLTVAQLTMMGKVFGGAAKTGLAVEATGTALGSTLATTLGSLLPNAIVGAISWEIFKTLPADLMTYIGNFFGLKVPGEEVLNEVNRQNGIETMGDVAQKIIDTPKEQNQRTMGFILDTILHPGRKAEDLEDAGEHAAAEMESAAAEVAEELDEGAQAIHDQMVAEFGPDALPEFPESKIPEVVEDVTLPDYLPEEIDQIIQDWWDAYKEYDQNPNPETEAEENREFQMMTDALGDDFGDFWDRFLQQQEEPEAMELEDLPADLYNDLNIMQAGLDTLMANQYTGEKVQENINSAKTAMENAVRSGLAAAHMTLTVNLDGEPIYRNVGMGLGSLLARM